VVGYTVSQVIHDDDTHNSESNFKKGDRRLFKCYKNHFIEENDHATYVRESYAKEEILG